MSESPVDSVITPVKELLAVDLFVDGAGRLGKLSYLLDPALGAKVGDCLKVPFGKRELTATFLGPATDPSKAKREVLSIVGARTSEDILRVCSELSDRHISPETSIYPRLAPTRYIDSEPAEFGAPALAPGVAKRVPPRPDRSVAGRFVSNRQLWITDPLVEAADAAALAAMEIVTKNDAAQVLVLAPTEKMVTAILARFITGAARLDTRAKSGAYTAFTAGSLQVGIATRSAALYLAKNLAGVVIAQEEHPGHIEATAPYTHVREVADLRTKNSLSLTIISSNPSVQAITMGMSIMRVGSEKYWPKISLITRVAPELDSSDPAIAHLKALDAHATLSGALPPLLRRSFLPYQLTKAIVEANRAGITPYVLVQSSPAKRRCVGCGALSACPWCSLSTCEHKENIDPCPRCKSVGARMTGWDASRVENLFAGSVKAVTYKELSELSGVEVLIIFDADAISLVSTPIRGDFFISVLLTAMHSLAANGKLLVCADNLTDPVIRALVTENDLPGVARIRYNQAKADNLPPFGNLITVTSAHNFKTDNWPGRVHGPSKVGANWEAVLRCDNTELLVLKPILKKLLARGKSRVRVN